MKNGNRIGLSADAHYKDGLMLFSQQLNINANKLAVLWSDGQEKGTYQR